MLHVIKLNFDAFLISLHHSVESADRRMTGPLHVYDILLSLVVVFNFLCSNNKALASSPDWISEDPLGHPQYGLSLLTELMANSTTAELIAGTDRKFVGNTFGNDSNQLLLFHVLNPHTTGRHRVW